MTVAGKPSGTAATMMRIKPLMNLWAKARISWGEEGTGCIHEEWPTWSDGAGVSGFYSRNDRVKPPAQANGKEDDPQDKAPNANEADQAEDLHLVSQNHMLSG